MFCVYDACQKGGTMGPIIREDDHLISSLLDLANLRFAPCKYDVPDGIVEMAGLQKKFDVFSDAHPLADSFAVLGLAGLGNTTLKAKWYKYLNYLKHCKSETEETGDRRIVSALRENLTSASPLPVYFMIHEGDNDARVLIKRGAPLSYIKTDYLIVSLPMVPWTPDEEPA